MLHRPLIVAAALLLGGAASAEPAQTGLVSGDYGQLALIVQDGRVGGVFFDRVRGNGEADAPQFSCLFLLQGHVKGDRAEIEAWVPGDPEHTRGTLQSEPAAATLRLAENPPGCAMAANMMGDGQRQIFEKARPDWIGAGLVTADRAILQAGPAEAAGRRKPYLVKWDAVAVLEQQGGWAHVEYVQSEKRLRGWIKASDLTLASLGSR